MFMHSAIQGVAFWGFRDAGLEDTRLVENAC